MPAKILWIIGFGCSSASCLVFVFAGYKMGLPSTVAVGLIGAVASMIAFWQV